MAGRVNKELRKPRKSGEEADYEDGHADDGALPDGEFIKQHIASLSALRAEVSTITGKIGAEVKAAENDHNVHRGAAALALKLWRMDAEKRDEMLRHFDSYRLQLGFGRQDDLFNDPTPAEAATFAGRDVN